MIGVDLADPARSLDGDAEICVKKVGAQMAFLSLL